jgi:hypothetical protein
VPRSLSFSPIFINLFSLKDQRGRSEREGHGKGQKVDKGKNEERQKIGG